MAQFGIGNFLYDLEVSDGNAKFHFFDNEDPDNTADVSVAQKDFPGGNPATSREVADFAYAQCQSLLNEKRDNRIQKEAEDALKADKERKAAEREAATEFHNNSVDLQDTTPTGRPAEAVKEQLAPPHDGADEKSDDGKKKGK